MIVESRAFLPGRMRIPVPVSITAFYALVALVVLLSAFFLSPAPAGRGELSCTCRWVACGAVFSIVAGIAFYRAYTMQPTRPPTRE
jgi:hypothetical protein